MIKKPFIGLTRPEIKYNTLTGRLPALKTIPKPEKVILFSEKVSDDTGSALIAAGDKVKTGQKIPLFEGQDEYVTSSVTGTITSISSYTADFGRTYTAVEIDVDTADEMDDEFGKVCETPSLENAVSFLDQIPGGPCLKRLASPDKPIKIIVITGTDSDLLITTSQYALKSNRGAVKNGIKIIKDISGLNNIVITVPVSIMQDAAGMGAEINAAGLDYPSANQRLIAGDILGRPLTEEETPEDAGICFISAEAVAAIGSAYSTGTIPLNKLFTLVKQSGETVMVSARIGTLLKDVFNALDIKTGEKDRIIIGGPMTGSSVYSEDYPVNTGTEAVMVQGKNDVQFASDMACINCGECVRICPALVPVNLLVRYLDAGQYQEAADNCDLYSCVDCGLCSLVCTAKIPVFQYIRLAKYELARVSAEDENND